MRCKKQCFYSHPFIYIEWYWILIESIVSLPYFFYQVVFFFSRINCWTISLCSALLKLYVCMRVCYREITLRIHYTRCRNKSKYGTYTHHSEKKKIMSTSLPNTLTHKVVGVVWGNEWIIIAHSVSNIHNIHCTLCTQNIDSKKFTVISTVAVGDWSRWSAKHFYRLMGFALNSEKLFSYSNKFSWNKNIFILSRIDFIPYRSETEHKIHIHANRKAEEGSRETYREEDRVRERERNRSRKSETTWWQAVEWNNKNRAKWQKLPGALYWMKFDLIWTKWI